MKLVRSVVDCVCQEWTCIIISVTSLTSTHRNTLTAHFSRTSTLSCGTLWVVAIISINPSTQFHQSNSSMHHYECVALCKDNCLLRGRFCARSLASCIWRSSEDRSSWMFFIQVVHGHPGGRLQFSGGGLKMAYSHPFVQDAHTHTHTCLTTLCPGLPGWAGTRKVKPIWILLN